MKPNNQTLKAYHERVSEIKNSNLNELERVTEHKRVYNQYKRVLDLSDFLQVFGFNADINSRGNMILRGCFI
jgi:hypothetical protein